METDKEFYTRRAQDERQAVKDAKSDLARESHQLLAETYQRKADAEKLADDTSRKREVSSADGGFDIGR